MEYKKIMHTDYYTAYGVRVIISTIKDWDSYEKISYYEVGVLAECDGETTDFDEKYFKRFNNKAEALAYHIDMIEFFTNKEL